MSLRLRPAQKTDAARFVNVKKSLPMPADLSETVRGGFLLGTNEETYRFYIENGYANVLEDNGKIVGFAIVLPDVLIRSSELWRRKDKIRWSDFDSAPYEDKPLCYFEQLGVLPNARYRFFGVALAYLTLKQAFETHEAMFTTIVKEPLFNQASVPFLENVGGRCVGEVDEFLPEFGKLLSKVYFVDRETFYTETSKHPIIRRVNKQLASFLQ